MLRQIIAVVGVIVAVGAWSAAVGENAPGKALKTGVVQTFDDLYKQPEITLDSGVKVRLGIGAERIKAGEEVLVYCLTDETAVDHLAQDGEDIVGPLSVFVERRGEKDILMDMVKCTQARQKIDKGDYLFAHPLSAGEVGEYVVRLKERNKVVAQMTFKVEKAKDGEAPAAWTRFCEPSEQRKIKDGDQIRLDVDYLSRALPKWDGSNPWLVKGPNVDRTKEALPTLVPRKIDPGLKLSVEGEGDLFTLESDHPMTTSWIQDYLLARWWVNGKEYVPPAAETDRLMALSRGMGRSGRVQEETKIQLVLEMDPIQLGARKGDKMAVQILYCEGGVEEVLRSMKPPQQLVKMRNTDSGERIRMSNKVEFVAP